MFRNGGIADEFLLDVDGSISVAVSKDESAHSYRWKDGIGISVFEELRQSLVVTGEFATSASVLLLKAAASSALGAISQPTEAMVNAPPRTILKSDDVIMLFHSVRCKEGPLLMVRDSCWMEPRMGSGA